MKILLFIPRIVIATFKALRKKISGMKMDDITKEISPKKLKKCKVQHADFNDNSKESN